MKWSDLCGLKVVTPYFKGVTQIRSGRIPFYEARDKIKTYLESSTSPRGCESSWSPIFSSTRPYSGLLRTRRWRPFTRTVSLNPLCPNGLLSGSSFKSVLFMEDRYDQK